MRALKILLPHSGSMNIGVEPGHTYSYGIGNVFVIWMSFTADFDSHMALVLGRPRIINANDCDIREPIDCSIPENPLVSQLLEKWIPCYIRSNLRCLFSCLASKMQADFEIATVGITTYCTLSDWDWGAIQLHYGPFPESDGIFDSRNEDDRRQHEVSEGL